ncbi:hypothetical protein [Pseudarthrobacter sp. J47]|uniref:hypothetical protein n=1 Tax=Pseudarthrobacter sp. J47 TaxID=3116482 RepID=UPI002E81DB02|nr:hypothetical protein [Pseudarthrobacter sp. J47]MEE2524646.1 hypothetical protein [Pseudarthrobacter sp. J47]
MTGNLTAETHIEPAEIDLMPVVECLTSGTRPEVDAAWPATAETLAKVFDPATWGITHDVNSYGQESHANLYNNEIQSDFRKWLTTQNISVSDYAQAVGELHRVAIEVHLHSLLPSARSNKGWRLRLAGFPALKIVAFGLCSHYQGTQNQNQMGKASGLIRAQAMQILPPDLKPVLNEFKPATPEDWDDRGLMPSPVLRIGTLDISEYDQQGAKLRMIRTTTAKKELSTYFALKGMPAEEFKNEGIFELQKLRQIALALGNDRAD